MKFIFIRRDGVTNKVVFVQLSLTPFYNFMNGHVLDIFYKVALTYIGHRELGLRLIKPSKNIYH